MQKKKYLVFICIMYQKKNKKKTWYLSCFLGSVLGSQIYKQTFAQHEPPGGHSKIIEDLGLFFFVKNLLTLWGANIRGPAR